MLLITTEAAAYGKSCCEIHIKADPAPHKSSKPYKRKQTSMFVPYSRITASVSLYTTSCSPFSSCLSDLPSSTDYIFPPSPSPSCISLSFFSPLSYPAHIFLSYFSHSSSISPAFLTAAHHSPKPEVTKSDKKKRQAAATGNPSRQEDQEPDRTSQIQENRQEQTTDRKYKEGTGQGNIRYRKGQAKAGRQKGRKWQQSEKLQEGSRISPSSHHTPAPRSLHPFSSAPAGQQDNRISCEFQEQAEIG